MSRMYAFLVEDKWISSLFDFERRTRRKNFNRDVVRATPHFPVRWLRPRVGDVSTDTKGAVRISAEEVRL